MHEASVYQDMVGLQNQAIPQVLAPGKTQSQFLLATELQEDVLDVDLDSSLYGAALEGLKSIHSRGWLHGGIQVRNICRTASS